VARDALLDLLTKALPALVLAASDNDVGALVSVLGGQNGLGDRNGHSA
jgi:hypothetical protein